MKHVPAFFSLILFLAISVSSVAQLRKIPAAVTDRFSEKYPMATSIEWRDKLSGFAADFVLNDTTYTASFTNTGEWASTETTIDAENLPAAVAESFRKSKYSDWEMGTVHRIETPGNDYQYRLQVIKSEIRKRNLYFSSTGKMLRDLMTL